MIRYAMAALATAAGAALGAPQAEAECPEGAFQHVYSIRAAMLAGQVQDANTPYSVAMAGIQQCPDDPNVQGLSSTVLAVLASGLVNSGQDAATVQTVLESALNAALVNERLYSSMSAAPTVKFADGTEKAVYPYSEVNHYLKTVIYPELLRLQIEGAPQAMFSGETLEACPYPGNQDRARLEAETLSQLPGKTFTYGAKKEASGFREVEQRLLALRSVCEKQKPAITWELAQLTQQRGSKLLEYLGHGNYADARAAVIAETRAVTERARAYYREFWDMDVTDSRDRQNQDFVSNRIGNLGLVSNEIERLENAE